MTEKEKGERSCQSVQGRGKTSRRNLSQEDPQKVVRRIRDWSLQSSGFPKTQVPNCRRRWEKREEDVKGTSYEWDAELSLKKRDGSVDRGGCQGNQLLPRLSKEKTSKTKQEVACGGTRIVHNVHGWGGGGTENGGGSKGAKVGQAKKNPHHNEGER